MSDLEIEIKTLLVRELQRHYHFDLKDPSMLLVKNPGTGNPIDKIISKCAYEIIDLIEAALKQAAASTDNLDPDYYD